MSMHVDRAVELYNKASDAESQGDICGAEELYLECIELFKQAGDGHQADAANVLNALGFMRQNNGDHAGALAAAEESAGM